MIPSLRYTLVGDGVSDRSLLPILTWVLRATRTPLPLSPSWAPPNVIVREGTNLVSRLRQALDLYPCDLLFVHRDAEKQDPQLRRAEIEQALADIPQAPPTVYVVPVRMTEAWLLFDEGAIRRASDNKHGKTALNLPNIRVVENIPDPKDVLNQLLCTASEKRGRDLHKFQSNISARRARVVDLIDDFSPLRTLPTFQQLETDIRTTLQINGWL